MKGSSRILILRNMRNHASEVSRIFKTFERLAKNREVSRIFKTIERFRKKFELNLLNVRIFCKCDKYSKDPPMRIFGMSESFANVKIISKIHQS